MSELYEMECKRPKKGEGLSKEEIQALLGKVPRWDLVEEDGTLQLEREFDFDNFAQALAFTNKVGELAEAQDHHPEIFTEWGKVTVTFWTHATGGLHQNDFIMAAKTSRLQDGA